MCNISEYEEVEVAPHISPPPQPDLNTDSESTRAVAAENYNKSTAEREYIMEVCETNNSVLSAPLTEVSSFYDISYCSKV